MKKILIAFLMIAPLTFVTTSCNSDDSSPIEPANPFDKFKGTWNGTHSGEDTEDGTWTATFDHNGKASGTLLSGNVSFELKGEVSKNGEITAEYSTGTTVVGTMSGTMTENAASGTWKSPLLSIQGTWSGTKK